MENSIPYGTFLSNILGRLPIGIILELAVKSDTLTQNQTLRLATRFVVALQLFHPLLTKTICF